MNYRFLRGNQLLLLESGTEYFPALIAAIDAAQHEIFLETYIFEDDGTGRLVSAALCRAAGRGVRVRVLVDGFGAREFPERTLPRLTDAGVEVLIYRREIGTFRLRRHRLRRMHRKVAVVDARVAFVGGINIIDDMHTPHQTPPRFDYAVRVEGPLLAGIHASARKLWELVAWANFRHRFRTLESAKPQVERRGTVAAAFLIRDNLRHRRDIEQAYLHAIATAREEILIANAYFLPGMHFRHALANAARRGVKVTILLQGRVEYVLLHYASQALYGSLLAHGVRLFEYHRSFLHAKVAVIDRKWATVGSSNIDPFSLLLAREANVVVQNRDFAGKLRQSLLAAMDDGATELTPAGWNGKPWYKRLMRWLAYTLTRAMIGLAGYGGEH
ncbi:MAG: cardiolipin synthase ClsB [Rhodocyclaceae bacterium]|nr:cardiolipin synthase ClsB [Rhodocyclaceae bacterium]